MSVDPDVLLKNEVLEVLEACQDWVEIDEMDVDYARSTRYRKTSTLVDAGLLEKGSTFPDDSRNASIYRVTDAGERALELLRELRDLHERDRVRPQAGSAGGER